MIAVAVIFWTCFALVAYAYVGYPAIVWFFSRRRPDAADRFAAPEAVQSPREWPFVSLVIAAYKEEKFILQRLHNAVVLDYPADRLEIIVGCDGNEDCTGELVESFGDPRVRLIQYPQRRGKASVLNDTVPEARGKIIVFSDANTMMDSQAIRRLARHFDNSAVGGVCGKLHLTDSLTGQNVDGLYWKYENFLKRCEGRLGALLGTNGGIYAIRKALYEPIPANTIIDDFLIGMRVPLRGFKLVYDATAEAFEETPPTVGAEFHRRARIGAGGFQSLVWLKSLLNPRFGWLAFAFFSHKLLRWICPLFLIGALAANVALAVDPLYFSILIAHLGFYTLAFAGNWLTSSQGWQRPLRLPAMFVGMNLALAFGFWRWLRGIRGGTWKRTERITESQKVAN